MRTDVLISKVNNRLQASLRTLRVNRYITINGRKKLGTRVSIFVPGAGISLDGPVTSAKLFALESLDFAIFLIYIV